MCKALSANFAEKRAFPDPTKILDEGQKGLAKAQNKVSRVCFKIWTGYEKTPGLLFRLRPPAVTAGESQSQSLSQKKQGRFNFLYIVWYHVFWNIKYDQICFGAVGRNDQKKWARPYDQKNLIIWSHRYLYIYILCNLCSSWDLDLSIY